MNCPRIILSLVAAAGLALTNAPVSAQQPPGGPGARSSSGAQPTAVTVDFRGGTLLDFVGALRGSTKEAVNVVLQGEANKITVDAMQLREVTPEAALRAALSPRIGVTETLPDGSQRLILLETVQPDSSGRPVHIVGVRSERFTPASAGPIRITSEVISIQRLVKGDEGNGMAGVPEGVVLSAIDAGLKLNAQGSEKPQIEYHKDSGLLLVRGLVGDVRIVQDIVIKMNEDQHRRASDGKQRRKNEIRLGADLDKASVIVQMAEQRHEAAAKRLNEARELAKSGAVPQGEVSDAELRLMNARGEMQMAKVELDRLNKERELGPGDAGDGGDGASEVKKLRDELERTREELRTIKDFVAKSLESKDPAAKKTPR